MLRPNEVKLALRERAPLNASGSLPLLHLRPTAQAEGAMPRSFQENGSRRCCRPRDFLAQCLLTNSLVAPRSACQAADQPMGSAAMLVRLLARRSRPSSELTDKACTGHRSASIAPAVETQAAKLHGSPQLHRAALACAFLRRRLLDAHGHLPRRCP
jgi:hypothetical protein